MPRYARRVAARAQPRSPNKSSTVARGGGCGGRGDGRGGCDAHPVNLQCVRRASPRNTAADTPCSHEHRAQSSSSHQYNAFARCLFLSQPPCRAYKRTRITDSAENHAGHTCSYALPSTRASVHSTDPAVRLNKSVFIGFSPARPPATRSPAPHTRLHRGWAAEAGPSHGRGAGSPRPGGSLAQPARARAIGIAAHGRWTL